MLDKTQMQEIQDLKLRGYTKADILEYYKDNGLKPPSRPTISKYYDMDVVSENPGLKLVKDKAFDVSPFREAIISILEANSRKDSIHFICLLLRYSRFLLVYAQDHKYNATEACQAIYRAFCKLKGRPRVLVIDQDAVFVASETYGEVIKTRVFEDFCTEQDLKLWVCNKADPESKGPIENSVGFVKKNFFSARTITCIDDVWRSLPGWLNRKNKGVFKELNSEIRKSLKAAK